MFRFCDIKLQQRFFHKEEVSISKKEIESLLDSLGEFLEAFDEANKVSQIPLPKPKFEIGFTKAKDKLFSHCYKDIVELLNRQIGLYFRLEKNKTCVFFTKKFEHYGNQFILTEFVNLGYREIKHFYKNHRFVLPTSVTFLRAITMCSAFTPDCAYDNSAILISGDVYSANTKCLGKLCLHKKTFQSRGRSDYQCPQWASMCQVRNIPFECQTKSFFLFMVKWFTFLKRVPNQFKMLLETCIVLASIVSTERNENLFWLSNNSEIHLWLWKLWRVVVCSQSSFHVTRARKDDKNRQNTLFLCEKKRCYPTNNCSVMTHFRQPNLERKTFV